MLTHRASQATVIRVMSCILIACIGCAQLPARTGVGPSSHVANVGRTVAADTSVFTAVLRTLRTIPMLPERVLVVPWRIDSNPGIATVRSADRIAIQAEEVRRLSEEIVRLGFEAIDDDDLKDCPGIFQLGRPMIGCPAVREARVVIGLPRAGGAYYPHSSFDRRAEGAALGHVSVRVIVRRLSRSGASATAMDFVFKKSADSWQLVERVELADQH